MKADKKILFEEIYNTYAKAIFRFIYLRVSAYEVAQDITGETFINTWKVIMKNTTIQNPRALLYVIARGLIVDYFRNKKRKNTLPIEKIDKETLASETDMVEKISRKEDFEIIFRKLKSLRTDYQEVILLRFVEDLSISEIATTLRKKENAVRVLLYRALQALKKKL